MRPRGAISSASIGGSRCAASCAADAWSAPSWVSSSPCPRRSRRSVPRVARRRVSRWSSSPPATRSTSRGSSRPVRGWERSWATTSRIATACPCPPPALLNQLVCPHREGLGDSKRQDLRRLEVDHQLVFHWLLDGKIRRLRTFEDLVRVEGELTEDLGGVRPVAEEPPGFSEGPEVR